MNGDDQIKQIAAKSLKRVRDKGLENLDPLDEIAGMLAYQFHYPNSRKGKAMQVTVDLAKLSAGVSIVIGIFKLVEMIG